MLVYLLRAIVLFSCTFITSIDGLVQERRNSSALAMELRLSCTNPSIKWQWNIHNHIKFQTTTFIIYGPDRRTTCQIIVVGHLETRLVNFHIYVDENFISGCTKSCQNDNFRHSQWRTFCQYDNISISVFVGGLIVWWVSLPIVCMW